MVRNFVELWHGELLSEDSLSKGMTEQIYWPLLNHDEREKAATFGRPDLQKKYIKTRGVLRKILSSYLDTEPQNIIIKTGEYGKPFLVEGSVSFNVSHTGNKFVVVVSNIGDIGVDIEHCRKRKNISALVRKCFSEVEISYWSFLSEEDKTMMFFRFWVRKEAFVKAVGRGLALGLDQCIINPRNQARFLDIPEIYGLASDWKILDVSLDHDDICAVVTKNQDFKYKQMTL